MIISLTTMSLMTTLLLLSLIDLSISSRIAVVPWATRKPQCPERRTLVLPELASCQTKGVHRFVLRPGS